MTRHETLTLICLMLILATDAALLYGYLCVNNQVQKLKTSLRAIPGLNSLLA